MYVYLTDSLRNNANKGKLFIGLKKPHKPVSSTTIGRWIKLSLLEAGIDTAKFSAHSTRSAASSKAATKGVPMDQILEKAMWASESTFQRFYKRSTRKEQDLSSIVLKRSGT